VIQTLSAEFPIQALCRAYQVSRSGYYQWLQRHENPAPRDLANEELLREIRQMHRGNKRSYGSPRVTHFLRKQGHSCGRHRVARLMRLHQIRAQAKRPFRPRTTDSRRAERIAPNLLPERGPAVRPNQIWAADITYIRTLQGWLYLAAVLDLCTREVVGWSLQPHMESSLVKEALSKAVFRRRPAAGLLHHSDRGVQYTSSAYQALLTKNGFTASMSRKGNCYDNAAVEAFWSTLKSELVHQTVFAGEQEARRAIFEYIEVFYNRERLHSALGYQSPVDFEQSLTYTNN
jgi:transposase InsO family protein